LSNSLAEMTCSPGQRLKQEAILLSLHLNCDEWVWGDMHQPTCLFCFAGWRLILSHRLTKSICKNEDNWQNYKNDKVILRISLTEWSRWVSLYFPYSLPGRVSMGFTCHPWHQWVLLAAHTLVAPCPVFKYWMDLTAYYI
jgi:hypothetical protein